MSYDAAPQTVSSMTQNYILRFPVQDYQCAINEIDLIKIRNLVLWQRYLLLLNPDKTDCVRKLTNDF